MPFDPQSIIAPDGPIARRLGPRYEHRPEQGSMIAAVERALTSGGRLLVEAGTGVGKSFAYLLPAIGHILAGRATNRPRRVIISTHTIALQEQLVNKDLPLLQAVIPDEFSAVLVKGRGNYVSLRRMHRTWERSAQLFGDVDSQNSLRKIVAWAKTTDDGSLATLPALPQPGVWSDVESDAEDCLGRRCPTYDKCFYQSARRRMEHADLLIVNHALFFADLAMRGEGHGFLPPYDHVILDEAHTVEDVASEHFGTSVSRGQVEYLLSRLHHARRQRGLLVALEKRVPTEVLERALAAVDNARYAADTFFTVLADWQQRFGRSNGRIDGPLDLENPLSPALTDLSLALKIVRDRLKEADNRLEVTGYANRAEALSLVIKTLLEQKVADSVYWLEISQRGRRQRLQWQCSPIAVGPLLAQTLFAATNEDDEPVSVIMTSATLATTTQRRAEVSDNDDNGDGAFTHVKDRLGCADAATLQLGSPFDYAAQAELIVDPAMPEPNAGDYFDKLAPRILEMIDLSEGGAFVLFTSYSLLERAARWLQPRLAQRHMPMLVQGQGEQRSAMLERFRGDRRSVLLGTDSFWQGVDVQGEALRNVIITRLPFAVPDRPLIEARIQRLREAGRNAFAEYSLPEAILKFRQGFGRLIRSRQDRGMVVVLDSRIVTKAYGRWFITALPALSVRRWPDHSRRGAAAVVE